MSVDSAKLTPILYIMHRPKYETPMDLDSLFRSLDSVGESEKLEGSRKRGRLRAKAFANRLKKRQTQSEALLWGRLWNKQIYGYKFKRQLPLYNRFLDFACHSLRLAIEVDGPYHSKRKDYDRKRDQMFLKNGWVTLRFTDQEVLNNLDEVVEKIRKVVRTLSSCKLE